MKTLKAPFTIVKVVDTREFIEDDDRFIPVGGSGDARECDRCNRRHEIHAHVIDADDNYAIVGIGCMNATTAETRKLAAAATREARTAAATVAAAAAAAELAAIAAAIPPFPADRIVHDPDGGFGDGCSWVVDDAKVYGFRGTAADDAERVACLRDTWRTRRLADGAGSPEKLRRLLRLADTASHELFSEG